MTAALYQWPAAARVSRVIPKAKFYERAGAGTALREKFVDDVRQITWAFKLAESTIHLAGDSEVPEIQVFVIDLKRSELATEVLAAIDKAVAFPIVFEIKSGDGLPARTQMTAAYKRIGGVRPQLSRYFTTEWQPEDAPREQLPPAVDLAGLYAGILKPLIPIASRPGETVSEITTRIDEARKLEREIARLAKLLRNEPQFNRKVELRQKLRECSSAHDRLLGQDHVSPTKPNP